MGIGIRIKTRMWQLLFSSKKLRKARVYQQVENKKVFDAKTDFLKKVQGLSQNFGFL